LFILFLPIVTGNSVSVLVVSRTSSPHGAVILTTIAGFRVEIGDDGGELILQLSGEVNGDLRERGEFRTALGEFRGEFIADGRYVQLQYICDYYYLVRIKKTINK